MENDKKPVQKQNIGVQIIKAANIEPPITIFNKIEKSDKPEQVSKLSAISASEWIPHPVNMLGLKELVDNSTILPQCIRAYKSNIAGFGISVHYIDDYEEETPEMKAEWETVEQIMALFNMDMMTKEVFENVIRDRETYGISYCEVIRDWKGNVVQLEFILDTPSIDMTYPLEPFIDTEYFFKGQKVSRRKKFRKFRQNVAGNTVYFKEFGDTRVMDKRNGQYVTGETKDKDMPSIDDEANEVIEFRIGSMPYGEVRWIGQVLTVDGNRRAEILNNNYFKQGRHTPLLIMVKGGTLSDASFNKLQDYMDSIKGESGQHAFMVLETENNEITPGFEEGKQPEIEIKDLAGILQKDELFQEYQENGRKKTQSAFLLPDLYTGYTTDFNRATAQTAMEVTEKQVFQPERTSLAWIVNNKLLNGYGFKYVETYFAEPDITNPDDIQKILNVTERAGGISPNVAKELTYKTLGKDGMEDYPEEWGDIPLQYLKSMPQQQVTDPLIQQVDEKIKKAAGDDESVLAVMKQIRKALVEYRKGAE